uniref:DNA repair and recombination protein RAD54-like n=1 Tax=Strongyloides venezuelensis TaxID=75913 RepID=A0A0K0EVT5_STRVS
MFNIYCSFKNVASSFVTVTLPTESMSILSSSYSSNDNFTAPLAALLTLHSYLPKIRTLIVDSEDELPNESLKRILKEKPSNIVTFIFEDNSGNRRPFQKELPTHLMSFYEKKFNEKIKGLKRKVENDQMVTCDDGILHKRSFTDTNSIRERINKLGEEINRSMQEFIIKSKSFFTPNGDCGGHLQKTLDMKKPPEENLLPAPCLNNNSITYTPSELTEEEKLSNDEKDRFFYASIDPLLRNILRLHQMEGVKFMYDCITGSKIENNYGCILADEMGLGKTLQCITLVWTLLRQSLHGTSTIDKAVIVCPSNLVGHWEEEFTKWLGDNVSLMVIGSQERKEIGNNLTNFMSNKDIPILVISYEDLRMHINILRQNEIGMAIFDEGHHLSNYKGTVYKAVSRIKCSKRIIVTSTPIKNDLLEYYNLVNFVNPGLLGSNAEFKKDFKEPIVKGKQLSSNEEQQKLGQEKLQEFWKLVNPCVIKRPYTLLTNYLPVKYEFIVFCSLTILQENLYKQLINKTVAKMKNKNDILQNLVELCNHPQLIYNHVMKKEFGFENCRFPPLFKELGFDPGWSNKMLVLDYLFMSIKKETNDKIVVVSNYSKTLDLLVKLCTGRKYNYVYLDHSTSMKQPSEILKEFNDPKSEIFILLLSSNAGCGMNLYGANRLVMFDPDWNPANDEQAMSRIWRDGQTKPCFIYRFFGTGTIEEKIFQKQIKNKALSSCVVGEQTKVGRYFGKRKYNSLFELKTGTNSETHDKLECKRCVNGKEVENPPDDANTKSDLSMWHHITKENISKIPDNIFRSVLSISDIPVSFIFYQKSHNKEV